ncbi:MAG TPA: sporulation protein YunB [Firmicutes bacterium]|nr:sporulation protein YunB [Bacillota bacterium]
MINWRWPSNSHPPPRSWGRTLGLMGMVILLLGTLTLMAIESRLAPVLYTWAETRAVSIATRAINVAVEEMMATSLSAVELAKVLRDGAGNIQAVQYDMGEVNRVSSTATHKILQTLNNLGQEVFPIPLGQLTGLDFLSSWGPGIPVRMIPVGGLTTTPVASFASAGINQTWHRISLDIQVTMRVVVPLRSAEILVSTQVPILDEIFIGQVPMWYFGSQGQSQPVPVGMGSSEPVVIPLR